MAHFQLVKELNLRDLGVELAIRQLVFSPDGRYLAAKVDLGIGHTHIVVWDLHTMARTADIDCHYYYGELDRHVLQFADNGTVTFGDKRHWNAITGAQLPELPVRGTWGKFNKDRTKLLIVEDKYFDIYDTSDWREERIYADGALIKSAAWTGNDNVLLGIGPSREMLGTTVAGYKVAQGTDVAFRLYDLKARDFTKTKWFPSVFTHRVGRDGWFQSYPIGLVNTDFGANAVLLDGFALIDGRSLEIHEFEDPAVLAAGNGAGGGGTAFTADGHYLFIKDQQQRNGHHRVRNVVIDVATAKKVASLPGGDIGIAITPDSRTLAIGNQQSIELFNIN